MEGNVYIFNLVTALAYLIVGARLFALSRNTRGRPEYLLALNYACTGVSYVLYELPDFLGRELIWVLIAARFIYSAGLVPLLLFTRDVFRAESRWANAIVQTTAVTLFSGVFFSMLNGDVEGLNVSSVWFWCDWIGYTAPYVWITAEALLAYSAARKRVTLGFCEPEVPNRYLLWALFGFFAAIAGISLIPLYVEYAATEAWPRWGDYASGGLEAAGTLMLWFAFFPPAWYRRWVNRAAPAPSKPAR